MLYEASYANQLSKATLARTKFGLFNITNGFALGLGRAIILFWYIIDVNRTHDLSHDNCVTNQLSYFITEGYHIGSLESY